MQSRLSSFIESMANVQIGLIFMVVAGAIIRR